MSAPHLWVRAEQRDNETRVGITPEGVSALMLAGFKITVEASSSRVIATEAYAEAGCAIVPEGSWPEAPAEAIIFGLKELPEDGTPLRHRHIMFGHAYKGQSAGRVLLDRFAAGGGTLLDLEYLTDDTGRRLAAFGYWAGFAGAAMSLICWVAQRAGERAGPVAPFKNAEALTAALNQTLARHTTRPTALIIGAMGRVGRGAADLCAGVNVPVTGWDMAETAHGGPFPEILDHAVFLNCILAGPRTPVFFPKMAADSRRSLRVIGDIACDPDSPFNPVPIYDRATTWDAPTIRVHEIPPLDVMAIDNLPSLLPLESAQDFAGQLLSVLHQLKEDEDGVWARAAMLFRDHVPN